jgi:hypothetical protein
MRILMLALACALLFAGCTKKDLCDNAKKVTAVGAPILSAAAECEVPAEVETWMNDLLIQVKLCEQTVVQGPVGEFICPIAFEAIKAGALKGLPAAAKCKKIPNEESLKTLFMAQCLKI